MKKKFQHLLSALLALCIALNLSTLPALATEAAFAGAGTKDSPWDISAEAGSDNVKAWFESDGQGGCTLYITGEGRMTDSFHSVDPPWKSMKQEITAVEIGEGVTNVSAYAFNFCKSLTQVSLPETLTEIGTYAFHSTGVKHLAIPSDVQTIGRMIATPNTYYEVLGSPSNVNDHAFCTSLVSVADPATADVLNAKTNVSAIIVLNGGIYGKTEDGLANLSYGLIAPEKEGYYFDGWYKNADFSGERCAEDANGRIATNINNIYYAKWTDEIPPTPSATPEPTPTAGATPTSSPAPTAEATPTLSPTPTAAAALTPSPTPTAGATPTLSPAPTAAAAPSPSAAPTPDIPAKDPVPVVEAAATDELLQIKVTLSEEDTKTLVEKQKALGEEEHLEVSIIIPEDVTEVSEEIKDVVITAELPQEFAETGIHAIIILPEKLLENAKKNEVGLTVAVLDSSQNMQVIWRFDAEQLASSEEEIRDIYLMVTSKNAMEANVPEDIAAMLGTTAEVIDFMHTGILAAPAEITLQTAFEENTVVYLYYYNEEKGCLDAVPSNEYVIGADGRATFHIIHCSKYVLSSEKMETARSLVDQMEALAGRQELYVGGTIGDTIDALPALPPTLKEATDFGTELGPAFMAVRFTYASSKPSVAKVEENGIVTAVKKGSATITVTAELSDGTVKDFEIPVKVSRASVQMIWTDQVYTVGSQISVSAELKGYDPADIRWMTSRRGIAVVRKYKGKTDAIVKAMGAGTDWIVIYSGDQAILRTKVVITKAQPEEEVQ